MSDPLVDITNCLLEIALQIFENQSGQAMWLKPLEGIFSFETAGDAD